GRRVVSATADDRVYDGTTPAVPHLSDNHLSGDAVTDSYAGAAFADKNVGTGKTVTVSGITVSGADAANYTLANTTATTTANISPLAITGSITVSDKVYDGTTAAAIVSRALSGALAGDNVSYVGGNASFADKKLGTGKTV